jgi:hypothetical protein
VLLLLIRESEMVWIVKSRRHVQNRYLRSPFPFFTDAKSHQAIINKISSSQSKSSCQIRYLEKRYFGVVVKDGLKHPNVSNTTETTTKDVTATSATASSFHFASTAYNTCLYNSHIYTDAKNRTNPKTIPNPNPNDMFRQKALYYLNHTFDPTLWFNDPVC